MVRLNSPGVCSSVKSKTRHVRRSLSAASLDVQGSVVMEKVWLFEGITEGISTEQLSEEDTGKDDWCPKHNWFLSTNLLTAQQCAKCLKRILPKRTTYKCTACKRLCHLKCAIDNTSSKQELQNDNTGPKLRGRTPNTTMDFRNFVPKENLQSCRYTRKTSARRHRSPYLQKEVNNNVIEEINQVHSAVTNHTVSVESRQQVPDLSLLSELHNTSKQSQTRQKLTSMKHGFVKRCRSLKKKVKNFKDKRVNPSEGIENNSDEQVKQESWTTTSSTQNSEEQAEQERQAWVGSPIRTRLRDRQAELRRESLRAKAAARRNTSNGDMTSIKKKAATGAQMRNSRRHRFQVYDLNLMTLNDRLLEVEKRVGELETAIPKELEEWHRLKQKFRGENFPDTNRTRKTERELDEQVGHETHPKHIEAMGGMPSVSSGTTSDEVYVVPDHQQSSSQDEQENDTSDVDSMTSDEGMMEDVDDELRQDTDNMRYNRGYARQLEDEIRYDNDHTRQGEGEMRYDEGYTRHNEEHMFQSPINSLNEESLPSGIPGKLKLKLGNNTPGLLQTSTPVTEREISFLSASRRYRDTHQIHHTNVTHINLEHSYCADSSVHSKTELKLERSVSFEKSPKNVLSPEQEAVKSFLQKRKKSNQRDSTGKRHESQGGHRSRSPGRMSSKRYSSPLDQSGSHSRSSSPLQRTNQSSTYNSPPIASSTFQEENNGYGNKAEMSPLSFTLRHDIGDNSQYSFARVDDTSKIEDARHNGEKNTSSASNFSYTFRNDSQMIPTNAEEDLPGYTQNYLTNRQQETNDMNGNARNDDDYPLATEMMVEADIENVSRAHVTFAKQDSMSTQLTTTTTTDDALSLTNVTAFTGDFANSFAETVESSNRSRWINKEVYMFERDDRGNPIKSKFTHSHEKIDATGDWRKPPIPNKQFTSTSEIDFLKEAEKRLQFYKTRKSGDEMTAGVCLEKLPCSSVLNALDTDSETDVREHVIKAYSCKHSAEQLTANPDYASPKHKSPTRGKHTSKSRSPSPKRNASPKSSPIALSETTCLKQGNQRRSPSPRSPSPKRSSLSRTRSESPMRSPSPKRSGLGMSRSPSPQGSPLQSRRSISSSRTPSPKRKSLSPKRSVSPKRGPSLQRSPVSHRSSSPKRTNTTTLTSSPKAKFSSNRDDSNKDTSQRELEHYHYSLHQHPKVNSTSEFEDFERQLHEESLQHHRRSKSLSNLHKYQYPTSNSSRLRETSISCTNSVDGETRSIINESARYHFLHDKGMIKISSPSLKLMNGSPATRRKYEPEYNHIDEEGSDMVFSGSESALSGVYVDNNFHLQGKTSSELDSKQTVSEMAGTETMSDSSHRSGTLKRQQREERKMFEQCLKTCDENQEVWDNVLDWMNKEYVGKEGEEVEHELDVLMQEEGMEAYNTDHYQGTKPNSVSPMDDSVYYSFQGQSEELRGTLASLIHPVNKTSYINQDMPGLMYVICNGTLQDIADYLNSDKTISENEIKEALSFAIEEQNYDVTLLLLEDVCKIIHGAEGDLCVDVFPTYLEQNRWQPVFVILTKQNIEGEWDSFMGFPVYRRRYDLVSNEATLVVNSDYVRSHPLTLDNFKSIRKALSSVNLQKYHSKITVINACPCKSKKGGKVLEKGLCIVIHCLIKGFIPFNESPFPKEIGGLPVDVREGYFRLGVATPAGVSDLHQQLWEFGVDNRNYSRSQSSTSSQASGCESGSGSKSDINNNSCVSGSSSKISSTSQKSVNRTKRSPRAVVKMFDQKDLNDDDNDGDISNDSKVTDNIIDQNEQTKEALKKDLHMGTSVCLQSETGAGTVGGFLLLPDGDIGFLTCAHSLTDANIGEEVYQQSIIAGQENKSTQGRTVCGKVYEKIYQPGTCEDVGCDVGVVKVTCQGPVDSEFVQITEEQLRNAGFGSRNSLNFASGKIQKLSDINKEELVYNIVKVGASTGLTYGQLYSDGVYVKDLNYFYGNSKMELYNQFEVSSSDTNTKFFDIGDSGALVFLAQKDHDLVCIGMAVGCTSYGSCVVTPIEAAFNALSFPAKFIDFTKSQSSF